MGGSESPSNTWFLRPTRVLNANDLSIGSAVFAGVTTVTDRLTDHVDTRSITVGHIYLRTAMRPNNNNTNKFKT